MLADIRNFITQSGVLWYQDKGLPHRLGFLFHGPPGTGKSSLAFAAASNFGLPIFTLNLSFPDLNDSDVEHLFASLPRYCIVLLEDIDATRPLTRDLPDVGEHPEWASGHQNMPSASPPHRAQIGKVTQRKLITLSGLLNAIDGIGAAEGWSRFLVLRTQTC